MTTGLRFLLQVLLLKPAAPAVEVGGKNLENPWAGGLQAPQFSKLQESLLVVLDRADERVLVFRRDSQRWRWVPDADTLLPVGALQSWMLLRDENVDGLPDLFTALSSTMRIFRQVRTPSNATRWYLAYDTLKTSYYGQKLPLYASFRDIPGITDVDGDGDLDLLVLDVSGSAIEWHKNLAVEQLGRRDTLLLSLASACWGKVYETYQPNTNSFTLTPCPGGNQALRTQHAGGTLLPLHLNGDNLMDLIIGDEGPAHLLAALNRGTPQEAVLDIATLLYPYPPPAPAYLPSFPAAYLEEVTGDSLPDLICANNDPLTGEDKYSVWLYENQGKVDSPRWGFPQVGWLQSSMLEGGTNAHPTLADLNRDGHPEIILSAERIGSGVSIFLLEGRAGGFVMRDTNWLNLAQVNERQFLFTAGDIDRDGAMDLLAGTASGNLWHWEESSPLSLSFILRTTRWQNINASPFAAPLLYDLDSDGDLDLLIGGRDGRIAYYQQHQGRFELITDFLGQIQLRDTLSSLLGFARPAIGDIDRDGTPELLVGNLTGFLYAYRLRPDAPGSIWPRKYRLGYRYGKRASPTLWQQGDSVLLLVGNLRGGVHAFTPGEIQAEPTALREGERAHSPCFFREGELLQLYDLTGKLIGQVEALFLEELRVPAGVYVAVGERGIPCRIVWSGELGRMQNAAQTIPQNQSQH